MDPSILIDERQDIQKKTFTKWINSHLIKTQSTPVNDLFLDLRDGHRLLALLSVLTNTQLKPEKGRMRVHHINNLNKVLHVVQEHGVKLVNISSDDIVSGNPKLTLGLLWLIALEFNGQTLVKTYSCNGVQKSLLSWARQFTEKHGLALNDFTSSWSDGKAFLMILDAHLNNLDLPLLLNQHPMARLKTAFDLAHTYFHIEKLLDPEDVHTQKPDSKSIQMYVMCLYYVMENQTNLKETVLQNDEKEKSIVNITDLDEVPLEDLDDGNSEISSTPPQSITDSADIIKKYNSDTMRSILDIEPDQPQNMSKNLMREDKSRPLSTATNVSIEITAYQAALEAVLTLLLEDEQILSVNIPEPHDFLSAKMQFQENEQFMLKLTEHQQYVGEALEEGSNLINESQKNSGLSLEDQNEVRQQMVLLNERWETLRLKALDVQAKILIRLANFQTQQMEKLRTFLTSIEDRISHMTAIGPTIEDVQKQLIQARQLKNDLEIQQELVGSLNNMVVIVNDESGNFNDLEDKLAALGERWSHVVKWSDLRLEKLQQYKCIFRWLDGREKDLKDMESVDVVDLGSITTRMNDLNYCAKDLLELERYLIDLRQMVAATLQEGDDKGERVLMQLESFEDRLDALKQMVEVQTERIEQKGFKFGRDRASYNESRVVRPDNWVDYQMLIKFGEDDATSSSSIIHEDNNISDNSENYTATGDCTHLACKKPKLRHTENLILLQHKILEAFNSIDKALSYSAQIEQKNCKEQLECLNNIEDVLAKCPITSKQLRDLYEVCEKENISRNILHEASNIKQFEERYDQLKEYVQSNKEKVLTRLMEEKFLTNLKGFKLVLADSRDWYQQHVMAASKEELEQRLSYMDSLSYEIVAAQKAATGLSNEEWRQDFNIFYDSWNDMKKALRTLIQEKGGLTEVHDKWQNLQSYCDRVFQLQVLIAALEPMETQLKTLQALYDEYEKLNRDYEFVQQCQPSLISMEFSKTWTKIPEYLNERVLKQTTAIENLNHFTAECNSIMDTLRTMKNNFEINENQDLKSKSSRNNEMELRKVEIDVISARNFSEIILKDAVSDHKEQLMQQIKQLNDLFQQIQDLYNKHLQQRAIVQAKTEEIISKLLQTEEWLNQLESNTPKTEVFDIKNSNELFQLKCKFQVLKETCEKESINFRELNELGGEILLQIDELKSTGMEDVQEKYNTLAKKFTRLNARWTEVTTLVYKKTALLEHISTQLGEFKKFIVSETGYLDRLENKMRSTPENADAEEIIEELDDLENVLRGHSDDWLEKIQEIGQELIANEFMSTTTRQEIEAIVERWSQLQQKAKKRADILEKEVSEAKQSEKCIVQFEAWLTRIDDILSEHLENDVTIEDLPDDFQSLAQEFEENEKCFQEIDELIAEHQRNGKTEAANRLQEQLNLLEMRFKSCQLKLNKCTAPQPAYESRLNRAVAELRNVERSTLVLDVASAGPSTVQAQYQKCLQIYRTLSEIKPEIENTIKTGRKVCEDKFTKSPKQLGQRIDALKHLYNALGENVTQSKIFLEGLIKLTDQLNHCYEKAEHLIAKYESPQELRNRNLIFLEFEDILQKCETIYDEYSKACDQVCMEDTRQEIDNLRATYLRLTSADVIKRLSEMKSTLQNLDNISLDTLRAMEHDLKQISVPSNQEIERLQQQVIAIVMDTLKNKFKENTILESRNLLEKTKELLHVEEDKDKKYKTDVEMDTEIVVVSDTVRQRRPRTPSANDVQLNTPIKDGIYYMSGGSKDDTSRKIGENNNKQISQNPSTSNDAETFSDNSVLRVPLEDINNDDHNNDKENQAQVVEIKVKNLNHDKMLIDAADNRNKTHENEMTETVNILESVEQFVPEFVETVQIIDYSEDSDSSDIRDTKKVKTKSKKSSRESPESVSGSVKDIEIENNSKAKVELRNTNAPLLRVEMQRISFEEKRKRIQNERDILRDEDDVEQNESPSESSLNIRSPKVKRWRQLPQSNNEPKNITFERDSFYNVDKEMNFDVEPLIFSDDEDVCRNNSAMDMTQPIDSDSDTSRIETPSAKKPNTLINKILPTTSTPINDNLQMHSINLYGSQKTSAFTELESKVLAFERRAQHMMHRLNNVKEQIEECSEANERIIEDMKMSIAPDAATLISQGDSLVLETHGKPGNIGKVVMKSQILLREKFREVQQARSKFTFTNTNFDDSRDINVKGINLEELIKKGLKRVNDLIEKPINRKSAEDLEKRISEIKDRRDDLKLIVNAIGKSDKMPKIGCDIMNDIEQTKNNLQHHTDTIELSLTELKTLAKLKNDNSNADDSREDSSSAGVLAGNFDKSILQISDWLTWEQSMIKIQSVHVDDVDAVRMVLEKQEKVLRELKIKKPQLNELVHTAEVLKGDIKRQQMQEKELKQFCLAPHCSADLDYMRSCLKVTRLREHWDEASQCVLQRAAQLKNMLGDSQRYEAKRVELEKWLQRMESRAERMGTVATTADILEAQQKEQKSFHAELHQHKSQFELFNTLTQKLIAVYPSDDTTRIKKMTEAINQRYANLNNTVISRGKQLHAAVHSLQSFDRAMDQFLAFLSESESLCETAEAEIDRNPLMFKGALSMRQIVE